MPGQAQRGENTGFWGLDLTQVHPFSTNEGLSRLWLHQVQLATGVVALCARTKEND